MKLITAAKYWRVARKYEGVDWSEYGRVDRYG